MTALQTKMLLAAYDNLTATLIGVRADITRSFGPLKDSSDLRDQMDYVEDWRQALYCAGKPDGRDGPDGPVADTVDGYRIRPGEEE